MMMMMMMMYSVHSDDDDVHSDHDDVHHVPEKKETNSILYVTSLNLDTFS